MARLFIVFLVLFAYNLPLNAQQNRIDSLVNTLSQSRSALAKADVLNQIASAYYNYDVNKGLTYAIQALEVSTSANYKMGIQHALSLKGNYYFETGDYTSALKYFREGAAIHISDEDDVLGYNYVLTGNLFRTTAAYDSANHYYKKAIGLLSSSKAKKFLAYAYQNSGRLQVLQWKNAEAKSSFANALSIYEELNDAFGKAEVYFALADQSMSCAEYKLADEYVSLGCDIAEKLSDEYLRLHCLINKGEIQYRLGEYLEALESLLKAVDLLNQRDTPQTLSRVYGVLGDIYDALGQNDLALRYYFEGLGIAERLNIAYEQAMHQANIAWVYKNQHNFNAAFDFIEKSIQIRHRINDEVGLSSAYNTKGIIYFEQDSFVQAEEWLNKSLKIRKATNHLEGTAICLYNLALVAEEQKLYKKSLTLQKSALEMEKKINNKYTLGGVYNRIGSLFIHLQMFDSAQVYLSHAQRMGQETKSLPLLMDNNFFWSEFYEAQGNTRQALHWHKQYAALNDSIYNDNSANKMAEMQALYQTDQKDKEIRLLHQQKLLQNNELELQKAKIDQQNVIIISIITGFLLVSVLAFKSFHYNKKIKRANRAIIHQKQELLAQSDELKDAYRIIEYINKKLEAKVENKTTALEQAYKELDIFFYRASHDFRRPLTTFLGLAEVANISIKDPSALELFGKVKETARNMDKMLLKLQSISDMGGQKMAYEEVYIAGIFNELIENYRADLESRQISIYTSVILPFSFYSYTDLVNIVVENLLENAINFSRYEKGIIKLKAFVQDESIVIEVEDNGEGVNPLYREKIYEMYYRGSERSKGNGLGLYIVKKAVEKLKGTIVLTSQPGKGSVFRVSFPPGEIT